MSCGIIIAVSTSPSMVIVPPIRIRVRELRVKIMFDA